MTLECFWFFFAKCNPRILTSLWLCMFSQRTQISEEKLKIHLKTRQHPIGTRCRVASSFQNDVPLLFSTVSVILGWLLTLNVLPPLYNAHLDGSRRFWAPPHSGAKSMRAVTEKDENTSKTDKEFAGVWNLSTFGFKWKLQRKLNTMYTLNVKFPQMTSPLGGFRHLERKERKGGRGAFSKMFRHFKASNVHFESISL